MREFETVAATYRPSGIPDLEGNPLVEALNPPPQNTGDIVRRLILKPKFDEHELALPAAVRRHLPGRLRSCYLPDDAAVDQFRHIHDLVLDGYRHRNPMTASGQRKLYSSFDGIPQDPSYRDSVIAVLNGPSGAGKTAFIGRLCAALGPACIQHKVYRNASFLEIQITSLFIPLEEATTPASFCKSICVAIEAITGESIYHSEIHRPTAEFSDLKTAAVQLLRNLHTAVLIVDDFQFLLLSKHCAEVLAMLVTFRARLGIPIVLVGTHAMDDLLLTSASVVSRITEGGTLTLKPPREFDSQFDAFGHGLWDFQWVTDALPYSEAVGQEMFELSQGIKRVAIGLFIRAQKAAIENESERVDIPLLREVFRRHMKGAHELVAEVRQVNALMLAGKRPPRQTHYEDMFPRAMVDVDGNKDEGAIVSDRIRQLQALTEQSFEQALRAAQSKPPATGVAPIPTTTQAPGQPFVSPETSDA